jgi:pyridoxal phosphate enzyme (YggS family)
VAGDLSDVTERLNGVRERIAHAAARAGRNPASVRLVAVSKTFGSDSVRAAARAGQIDFGENKVQEGAQKASATSDLPLRWHLIGHLQTNKAKKAGATFDVIHSVDDATLVQKIDEGAAAAGRTVELLVQVDLAREPTKFGAREADLPAIFDAAATCRHVAIVGLMLLPPAVDDPDQARPYFQQLGAVRDRLLASGVPQTNLLELSMGMSYDFEVAIEEGATMVRVGSAIFGARTYP